MAFSNTNKNTKAPAVTGFTKPTSKNGRVSIGASNLDVSGYSYVRTQISLDAAAAKAFGFRARTRVTVQYGTGRDKGKIRLIADSNGSNKLQTTGSRIYVQSTSLLENTLATKEARVVSATRGALTLAV